MVMSNYSGLEQHVINAFNNCENLVWKGKTYSEIRAFKPTTSSGECRTDTYVSLMDSGREVEAIKISIKKNDAEFMANKLTAQDAESLLGLDWSAILKNSINSIRNEFLNKEVFYLKSKGGKTDIYFTLGWKLEIANKPRRLSAPLALSKKEIADKIFRGTGQPDYRKNAFINGHLVLNSGIADYLLEGSTNSFRDAQSILNSLQDLSNYTPGDIYLIFTANNYRIKANKADGPRTLAVCLAWEVEGSKIKPRFIFDEPLVYKGETNMMPILKQSLAAVNAPINLPMNNLADMNVMLEQIEPFVLNAR